MPSKNSTSSKGEKRSRWRKKPSVLSPSRHVLDHRNVDAHTVYLVWVEDEFVVERSYLGIISHEWRYITRWNAERRYQQQIRAIHINQAERALGLTETRS